MAFDWEKTKQLCFWESKIKVSSYGSTIVPLNKALADYLPSFWMRKGRHEITRILIPDGGEHIKLQSTDVADWKSLIEKYFEKMRFELALNDSTDPKKGWYLNATNLEELKDTRFKEHKVLSWSIKIVPDGDSIGYFESYQVWADADGHEYRASYKWPPKDD